MCLNENFNHLTTTFLATGATALSGDAGRWLGGGQIH
jgi:hypothetical protein